MKPSYKNQYWKWLEGKRVSAVSLINLSDISINILMWNFHNFDSGITFYCNNFLYAHRINLVKCKKCTVDGQSWCSYKDENISNKNLNYFQDPFERKHFRKHKHINIVDVKFSVTDFLCNWEKSPVSFRDVEVLQHSKVFNAEDYTAYGLLVTCNYKL